MVPLVFAIVFTRNIWIATRCLLTPAKELGQTLLLCCGGIVLVGVSEEVLVDPAQISVCMLFVMSLTGERMLRAVIGNSTFDRSRRRSDQPRRADRICKNGGLKG